MPQFALGLCQKPKEKRSDYLRVQPAGSAAKLDWLMIPESVLPLMMGLTPKQEPSVGIHAVVTGVGPLLQPVLS